jgi:2-haloalkanoic acid dehalogenase type II
MTRRYDAVLFDLLSALVDSWTLWDDVAGGQRAGREWREEYLRLTYDAGEYRSYEAIVAEAARASAVPDDAAEELVDRWGELRPWPEAPDVLADLRRRGVPLGVVTNCSDRLGRRAAEAVGVDFETVATAERAGWYKPNPEPYQLARRELDVPADRTLFVSGSGRDVPGARDVGMDAVWHNRVGLARPDGVADLPTVTTLDPLVEYVFGETDLQA